MWIPLLAAGAGLLQVASAACDSYAIDFKNGGNYFINKNSNESFTAVSQFSGCTGIANVVLVAPNAKESFYCSDIATSSDYTDVTTTCPIQKNQMYSGDWKLVILNNNGDNPSFTASRLLHLNVGEQVTSVVVPTVTLNVSSTPVVSINSTITDLESVTLLPSTITSLASDAKTQVVTSYPPRETITKSSTATVKRTSTSFTYTISTVTATKVCAFSLAATTPDPTADPSLVAIASAAIASASATAAPARRLRYRSDKIKVAQVAKRHGIALAKRSPDSSTVTSTDTDTAHWISVTSTYTAAPVTSTAYSKFLNSAKHMQMLIMSSNCREHYNQNSCPHHHRCYKDDDHQDGSNLCKRFCPHIYAMILTYCRRAPLSVVPPLLPRPPKQ